MAHSLSNITGIGQLLLKLALVVGWHTIYTVNHKKRDILFLTITLATLNRFL